MPDLDQAKSAVVNSLSSVDAQRGYRHAIDEFVEWYCSEPRLSFNRTVVLRYRIHLEAPRRDDHWAIVDLIGKASHIRTIPVPDGVKDLVDDWLHWAGISSARLCHESGGDLEKIQFLLGHVSVQTTERYLGCKQRTRNAVNDRLAIQPKRRTGSEC